MEVIDYDLLNEFYDQVWPTLPSKLKAMIKNAMAKECNAALAVSEAMKQA